MAAEATTISATKLGPKEARNFQGLFDVIPFKFTALDTTIAANATSVGDVTVTGAATGDFVLLAVVGDVADALVTGQVTATDTVTITIANNIDGTSANTAFSAGLVVNGLVLKPKGSYNDLL